jgi:hypothetical protein
VAAVGFRDTVTGDTLVHSCSFAESLQSSAALPAVQVPDPVRFLKPKQTFNIYYID